MVKVGITGGIGSGKTTVCKVWEKLGAVVVYADDLAKSLMVEDEMLATNIRDKFGDAAYGDDGSLNRRYLAEEAFSKGRVHELNKLVHPAVAKKVRKLMDRAEAHGAEMFVEEAALLLKNGRPAIFDYIVIVTADKDRRVEWVSQRDEVEPREIIARMKNQQSFEELMPLCDFVLENNSTPESLKQKAADLYRKLLKLQNTGID
jgi:dephospho-CoA kinase